MTNSIQRSDEASLVPVVLLASGGLDSTVLAYWLWDQGRDVIPLFLDYGQHSASTELQALRAVLPAEIAVRVRVACVSDILASSQSRLICEADLWKDRVVAEDLIIPYRNVFLLASGAAFTASIGSRELYSAFINSNHAREIDATKAFLDGVSALMAAAGSVEIQMPFRDLSKAEVAAIGVRLGAPIALTYSCQAASETHCGACPNCIDRINALNSVS